MDSLSFAKQYQSAFIQHWLKFFIWGIALVLLGVVAISATTMTTIISIVFLGSLLLVSGVVLIIDAFTFWWNKWQGFFLVSFSGLLYLLLGILLVTNPLLASLSLTFCLGIFYLIIGISRVIYSVFAGVPSWGWGLLSGLVSLLLGILILANWPQSGLFIIGLFVGIDLLFVGWSYIMTSLAARSLAK
jgi:uncharacterized membrane protein HdeD (DUF308 family)